MADAKQPGNIIEVFPPAALAARPRLFATLTAAFPVSFRPGGDGGAPARAAAELHFAPSDRFATKPTPAAGRPALVLGERPWTGALADDVAFGEAADRRLRGLMLNDPLDGPEIDLEPGEEVLAATGRRPVWSRSRGDSQVERVASSLPELGPEQSLRELLFASPVAMVALIGFLRGACGEDLPSPPPLRAAFVFDDPNLRWRSYGYIDFGRLLAHADAHDYHAAMAMIPLDARGQHRATVELFRTRPDRLSLVMHGNNHLSQELLRLDEESEALATAAQAFRRAASFEARNDLRMDRVMMPPHGMCSASSAAALAAVGFDALCAIHPLPWREQPPAERPLAGWDPAEFAAGCAVIPRLPLGVTASELALRAFLDQPLVVYGHHGDLAAGLEPLAETAAAINALGEVEWTSLGEIAAGNAASHLDGSVLRVAPYSHRLRLRLPGGADAVAVEPPRQDARRFSGWSVDGGAVRPFGEATPERAGGELEIRLHAAAAVDPETVIPPAPSIWPRVRRTATETRDRLQPLLGSGAGR
jgi:hypothetical protein